MVRGVAWNKKLDKRHKENYHLPRVGKQSIPNRLKIAVALRDGGMCQNCGLEGFLTKGGLAYEKRKEPNPHRSHFDDIRRWIPMETAHIIPESIGGKIILENLVLMCRRCNRSLGPHIWKIKKESCKL